MRETRCAIGVVLLLLLLVPSWLFAIGNWLFVCAFELVQGFVYWRKPELPDLDSLL